MERFFVRLSDFVDKTSSPVEEFQPIVKDAINFFASRVFVSETARGKWFANERIHPKIRGWIKERYDEDTDKKLREEIQKQTWGLFVVCISARSIVLFCIGFC